MMRVLGAIVLILLFVVPMRADDDERAYFQATVCSSAASGAWMIAVVGDCGCLTKLYGVDCGGNRFAHYFRAIALTQDLDAPFDYYYSGTQNNGNSWFLKIDLDRDGRFARAWGEQQDGTFYEVAIQ